MLPMKPAKSSACRACGFRHLVAGSGVARAPLRIGEHRLHGALPLEEARGPALAWRGGRRRADRKILKPTAPMPTDVTGRDRWRSAGSSGPHDPTPP